MNLVVIFLLAFVVLVQPSLAQEGASDDPTANPGRPTVSTPATIAQLATFNLKRAFWAHGILPNFHRG